MDDESNKQPIFDEDPYEKAKRNLREKENNSSLNSQESEPAKDYSSSSNSYGTQQEKAFNASQLNSAESTSSNPLTRGLYNPNPGKSVLKGAGFKNFLWGSRKRKLITSGTGAAGGVTGFLIFLIMTAAGPAQLIQLSSVLQKNFSGMDQASTDRLSDETSYATSALSGAPADLGATRLGNLTQLVLGPILNQLESSGITLVKNSTGGLKSITIDPEQFASSNSEFAQLSSIDDQKAWLADQFSDIKGIQVGQEGNLITISDPSNPIEFPRGITRLLSKNTFSDLLDSDGIVGAMSARVLSTYLGAPSLFHPLKVATETARNKATTAAELKQQEEQNETTDVDDLIDSEQSTFDVAGLKGTLNDAFESSAGKSLTDVLVVQAIDCEVYSQVGNLVSFNRVAIVLPAALEAVRLMAVGDQIKAGQDVSSQEVGEVVDTLTNDQGQSIWNAKALQATENESNPTGTDLPTDYYQAFSGTTSANSIDSALSSYGINSYTCSTPAQIISAAIGVGALLASIPTDGGSAAAYLGARAAIGAGLGFSLYFVTHDIITGLLKDNAVVPAVLSGPLGGNLAAYGARAASNIVATSQGGVALSNTQSQQLGYQQSQQDTKQFESESFFARMFNIDDSRSLLGRIADSISPSISTNISNFTADIFNVAQTIPKELMGLLPKASADSSSTYDWGFPQYGIPSNLLDTTDPTMENPYENASMVVPLLQNDTDSVIERAQTCFGDNITDSSGVWDVVPIANSDVNPNSSSYEQANCNDSSQDWQRIILFVLDTRTMQSAACYEGDSTSCSEIGF